MAPHDMLISCDVQTSSMLSDTNRAPRRSVIDTYFLLHVRGLEVVHAKRLCHAAVIDTYKGVLWVGVLWVEVFEAGEHLGRGGT